MIPAWLLLWDDDSSMYQQLPDTFVRLESERANVVEGRVAWPSRVVARMIAKWIECVVPGDKSRWEIVWLD